MSNLTKKAHNDKMIVSFLKQWFLKGYQILTRLSGAKYMPSPSFMPKAS